jgi:enamine deaminase RidA (YjgF/YER057c/UK114 family)
VSHIEKLNPPSIAEPQGFVHVTVAQGSKLVFLAGQVGTAQDGSIVGEGDLAKQTAQALRNVKAGLDAAGATFDDIVKTTLYIVDWSEDKFEQLMAGVMEAAGELGGAPVSSSTLISVQGLFNPGYLIEVDVTAVVE